MLRCFDGSQVFSSGLSSNPFQTIRYSTRRFEALYRRPRIRSIAKTSSPSGIAAEAKADAEAEAEALTPEVGPEVLAAARDKRPTAVAAPDPVLELAMDGTDSRNLEERGGSDEGSTLRRADARNVFPLVGV